MKSELKPSFEEDVSIFAVSDGHGPGWNLSHAPGSLANVELHLADDLPIHGRIVNTQGKPVANAKIKMGSIMADPAGTVDFWVDTVMAFATGNTENFNSMLGKDLKDYQFFGQRLQLFPAELATDADGRFTIKGVGAGRVVFDLEVSGTGIANDRFSVITKPGDGIDLNTLRGPHLVVPHEYRTYGATFEHVVQDVRLVTGTVRDLATGLPIQGVQVAAWGPEYADAFTDADGKYQLVGLAPAEQYQVTAWPWENRRSRQPFVTTTKTVQAAAGQEPVTADFDLVRGVILRGKLTDKLTGKPIAKATILYAAFKGNPRLATFYYPGNPLFNDPRDPQHRTGVISWPFNAARMEQTHTDTGPDGAFDMIVLPGQGVLGVVPFDGEGNFAEPPELKEKPNLLSDTVPNLNRQSFIGLKLIEVPENDREMQVDFQIELQPKNGDQPKDPQRRIAVAWRRKTRSGMAKTNQNCVPRA